ncbi:amidohydrolase family protein [Streptomyces malaysiensis]|uniref:Amidohydrolase-related domain-containing protein n=1 Tax=Streptomyces malaysiensis TaxID=92644 RepID=A0A7X6B138_STRMQ|nr:amidohydrolase family protein [Streptomyces malaysiensis]NIY69455.1 hypothetical protein [Streptomyces malaysiensis]
MPVIDVWMQHPTLRHSNHEMFESLRRWTGRGLLEEPVPVEATVAAMAAADVEIGLSAAWYGPQGSLIGNDEVAEFVAESEGRLRGVAGVDLTRPVQAVRELRRAVEELGFVALRVVPWLWGLPPTDRLYYPLYAACVDLGIPFCTQVGHTGPLRPSETGRPILWGSNNRRSWSSGIAVLVDHAAEDAGTQDSSAGWFQDRRWLLVGLGR